MSVVYLAEEIRLRRRVALKVLWSPVSDDDAFRQRFIKETRTIAAIEHPHIVPVYDAGEAEEFLYLAMRYVEGVTLGDVIRHTGPLDPDRAVSILEQVCSALDTAHGMGVIHRDVKPANVLIDTRRGNEEHATSATSASRSGRWQAPSLTAVGQMVGTVHYAAPEQIEGRPVDERTDVYALGCVLYECLTGTVPFALETTTSPSSWRTCATSHRPCARLRPELPAEMESVINRAMAKSPRDRYDSCMDLAEAARRALDGLGGGGSWRTPRMHVRDRRYLRVSRKVAGARDDKVSRLQVPRRRPRAARPWRSSSSPYWSSCSSSRSASC